MMASSLKLALYLGLSLYVGLCGIHQAQAEQCVPFARSLSGVSLTGNAQRWWPAANGIYERGITPKVGAVMVFKPTTWMRLGHVAVVRRVVGGREIRIDHANWGKKHRGRISLDALVIDVSAANDWSQVRVWYDPAESMGGRVNPVHGFIYPATQPAQLQRASAHTQFRTLPPVQSPPQIQASSKPRTLPPVQPSPQIQALPQHPRIEQATASPRSSVNLNAAVLARLRGISPDDVLKGVASSPG